MTQDNEEISFLFYQDSAIEIDDLEKKNLSEIHLSRMKRQEVTDGLDTPASAVKVRSLTLRWSEQGCRNGFSEISHFAQEAGRAGGPKLCLCSQIQACACLEQEPKPG